MDKFLQLEVVNKNLEAYYDAWDKFIKSWIVIKIKDPSYVYQWRLQVSCRCILLSIFQKMLLCSLSDDFLGASTGRDCHER